MNMIDKESERYEIEALLPWYAAGTLSRHDADRVEQALAGGMTSSARSLRRRFTSTRRSAYRRRAPWRSCSPQLMPRRQVHRPADVGASADRYRWGRHPLDQ